MKTIAVTGSFDNLRSKHVRFLEEAAKWEVCTWRCGRMNPCRRSKASRREFPERERAYLLQSLRFVDRVTLVRGSIEPDTLPDLGAVKPDMWIVDEEQRLPGKRAMRCRHEGFSTAS